MLYHYCKHVCVFMEESFRCPPIERPHTTRLAESRAGRRDSLCPRPRSAGFHLLPRRVWTYIAGRPSHACDVVCLWEAPRPRRLRTNPPPPPQNPVAALCQPASRVQQTVPRPLVRGSSPVDAVACWPHDMTCLHPGRSAAGGHLQPRPRGERAGNRKHSLIARGRYPRFKKIRGIDTSTTPPWPKSGAATWCSPMATYTGCLVSAGSNACPMARRRLSSVGRDLVHGLHVSAGTSQTCYLMQSVAWKPICGPPPDTSPRLQPPRAAAFS